MDVIQYGHGEKTAAQSHTASPQVSDCFSSTVTVVMCDIVSSTHLSTTLPCKTLRSLLLDYYRICDDIVREHNGRTLQYTGDGILSAFGTPFSESGTASDAVCAGLSISTQEFCYRDHPYEVRVAASTGEIVTGIQNGSKTTVQDTIFGSAPFLVARLQAIADPGSMLVDESTFEAIDTYFKTSWTGSHTLRGFPQPQSAWLVQSKNMEQKLPYFNYAQASSI